MLAVYTSWYADHVRKSSLQRICAFCAPEFVQAIVEVSVKGEMEGFVQKPLLCPSCGGSLKDDEETLFLTAFPPHDLERKIDVVLCSNCMSIFKPKMLQGGIPQGDRYNGVGSGLGAPKPTSRTPDFADLPWDS